MRLTAELIRTAPVYVSAIGEREKNLRGYKVAVIENFGVTQDEYEAVDLCENDIAVLDGFPILARMRTLLLADNKVARVGADIGTQLANLRTVVLTNNKISQLSQLRPLAACRKLEWLSLVGCPITGLKNYRLLVAHLLPALRVLDCKKVTDKERADAISLLGPVAKASAVRAGGGAMQVDDPAATNTFTPGGESAEAEAPAEAVRGALSAAERARIMKEIQAATSLGEIERLEALLAADT